MESASVSDLKRSPSGYFRKVKAGEEILITDRGRPIAKIIPLRREGTGDEAQLAKLEAAALPPSAEIPALTDPRPVLLRDKALASEGVFKCIASFL